MHTPRQVENPSSETPPPGRPALDLGIRPPLDALAILCAFAGSPEAARLQPDDRDLFWVQELLEAMEAAGWTWLDLDLEMFEAVLLDGLSWSIERAPEDPERVARVLDAFLGFAGRAYGAPHAPECCAYLRSPVAAADIARWLRPFEEPSGRALFAELSAPYNWCDGRCDRCPLAATCPVHNLQDPDLAAMAVGSGDAEEKRAAALAATHEVAAREAPAVEEWTDIEMPPEPPEAARLRELCREYAFAVLAVRDALAANPDPVDARLGDVRADAMLVAVKGSRVACHLSAAAALEDDGALMDGVPNLMLLERVMAAIDGRLAAQGRRPDCVHVYRRARDDLGRALKPLLRAVPSRFRDELQFRILTGSAPSPFGQPVRSHSGSRAP